MAALGQRLHLVLVLEELEPLRREDRLEPRDVGLGDLLLLERRLELRRRRARLIVRGQPASHGGEQLERFQLAAQVAEPGSLLRGPLERREPLLHLGGHVGETEQVLLGRLELALGLLAPGLVLRDAGGLLENAAAVLGPRADD